MRASQQAVKLDLKVHTVASSPYRKTAPSRRRSHHDEYFALAEHVYNDQVLAFLRSATTTKHSRRTQPCNQSMNQPCNQLPALHSSLTSRVHDSHSTSFKPNQKSKENRKIRRLSAVAQGIIQKCTHSQDTSDARASVKAEQAFVKKFCQRIAWTSTTLQEHRELDMYVLRPYLDHLATNESENEAEVRQAVAYRKKASFLPKRVGRRQRLSV